MFFNTNRPKRYQVFFYAHDIFIRVLKKFSCSSILCSTMLTFLFIYFFFISFLSFFRSFSSSALVFFCTFNRFLLKLTVAQIKTRSPLILHVHVKCICVYVYKTFHQKIKTNNKFYWDKSTFKHNARTTCLFSFSPPLYLTILPFVSLYHSDCYRIGLFSGLEKSFIHNVNEMILIETLENFFCPLFFLTLWHFSTNKSGWNQISSS